jgi:predicted nucleic acid-binding protein
VAAKSDYLVSGDADLLELKTFRGIKIVKPKKFEMFFLD